jgi:hypothetical protein
LKTFKVPFWKATFSAAENFKDDQGHYDVEIKYGLYKYYKNDDTTQKPEICHYRLHDASVVVKTELSELLDYTNPREITSKFSSINNTTCTIITGADHGQGAW